MFRFNPQKKISHQYSNHICHTVPINFIQSVLKKYNMIRVRSTPAVYSPDVDDRAVMYSNKGKKSNGGVIAAIICGVVLIALLGVTVGLLAHKKKTCHRRANNMEFVRNQYITLAKISLGPLAESVSDDDLEHVGRLLHGKNVRSGASAFRAHNLSKDDARSLLSQARAHRAGGMGGNALKHSPTAISGNTSVHSCKNGGHSKENETSVLTKAFQGGMDVPPCQFNIPVDAPSRSGMTGAPLTADKMSALGDAAARRAQHAMIKHTPGDCKGTGSSKSMLETMQEVSDAETGRVFAGKLPAEYGVDKTAAAIAAVGGKYGPSNELQPANYEPNPEPGTLYDGNKTFSGSHFVQAGTAQNVSDVGQSSSAVLSAVGDIQITDALAGEEVARHQKAFDLSSKLPGSALLTGDAAEQHANNSKNLQLLAKANPEIAGQLLMNAGSVGRVNAASMLQAHLNVAAQRPLDANPVFRTWNFPTTLGYNPIGGVPRATPVATSYVGNTFNVPQTYFDAYRQSSCS